MMQGFGKCFLRLMLLETLARWGLGSGVDPAPCSRQSWPLLQGCKAGSRSHSTDEEALLTVAWLQKRSNEIRIPWEGRRCIVAQFWKRVPALTVWMFLLPKASAAAISLATFRPLCIFSSLFLVMSKLPSPLLCLKGLELSSRDHFCNFKMNFYVNSPSLDLRRL